MAKIPKNDYKKVIIELYIANDRWYIDIVNFLAEKYGLMIGQPLVPEEDMTFDEFIIPRSVERYFPKDEEENK